MKRRRHPNLFRLFCLIPFVPLFIFHTATAQDAHWSLVAPTRPPLPVVKNPAWARNPIDRFILARLEHENLKPSPEADRAMLLRRVSLDLTGLPPTLAELDAFINDRSPDAYEKVVDRLLASPRYGERMAFRWLDAARYADTNGYQIDGERSMWRWRDWVIEAFNRNLSYDRFIIEQLSGDLLPDATLDNRLATAFNRHHRINAEGGIVPEEYAVEYVVDRVDTMSTVFMGLTVGCARCHNHKYDPISQRDYYRLYAYFNSIPEDGRAFDQGNSPPWMGAPTREQQEKLRLLDRAIARVERRIDALVRRLVSVERRWERGLKSEQMKGSDQSGVPRDGLLLNVSMNEGAAPTVYPSDKAHHHPPVKKTSEGAKPEAVKTTPEKTGFVDGAPRFIASPIGQGVAFDGRMVFEAGRYADFRYKSTSLDYRERFTISAWIYPEAETSGAIVTKMRDKVEEWEGGLPRLDGLGLFFVGGKLHFNLVREWGYDGLRVETERNIPLRAWHHVAVVFDGTQVGIDRIRLYIDGEEQGLKVNQGNFYLYWGLPETPLRIGGGGGAEMRFRGAIDEVRIYARRLEPDELARLACADSPADIAAIPAIDRTPAQKSKMRAAFIDHPGGGVSEEMIRARRQLAELKKEKWELVEAIPNIMVMEEAREPSPTFVLRRGAYDAPGERVERGVPSVLPPLGKGEPNNRLGLARWLVRPGHPLTSRVAVNRFWAMIFGTGLVATVEDFGEQGEPPSHPELLDFLATEFVRSGWDVKALLKTIVTSATYRQSSKLTSGLQARDPQNRLLARAPRLRLSAEMIRDQALFASGLMVEKLGGPSVKPYQPDGLYKDMVFPGLPGYVADRGDGLWRRSLYTYWKRTVLAPNMGVFDASAREFCTVRETRTNTPLQALNLMNDATYVEAARMLAERMMKEGGSRMETRLAWAFRMVTSRSPDERELRILVEQVRAQMEDYRQRPAAARQLLGVGEKRNAASLTGPELAAYAAAASLLLNLDEAITRQ